MGTFNERLLRVEDGKPLPPRYSSDRFPRELLWFYCIERLRVVERGWGISEEGYEDEDDWEKLLTLLCE
jgi:hypothetical protein